MTSAAKPLMRLEDDTARWSDIVPNSRDREVKT
jgi:hypothetical protein